MSDDEFQCFAQAVKDVCKDSENYRKNWYVFRDWPRVRQEKWLSHVKAMAEKESPMFVAILTRTIELRLTSGSR